jgi:hypothetical protein
MAIALQILLLAACASSSNKPPVETVPRWTAVPSSIVQAMCTKLHTEGMRNTVNVETTTEPLITRETLIGLAEAAEQQTRQDPEKLAAIINGGKSMIPVTVDGDGGCSFHPVTRAKDGRTDEMLLQFSPPLVNPFERGSAGVFARLSLAGEAPQWYWVPIRQKNGTWYPGMPMSLAPPR